MFKCKTKFKKGDVVLVLKDLSNPLIVENVYMDKNEYSGKNEMVVLSNSKVYHASELTFNSAPLQELGYKIKKIADIYDKNAYSNNENFKSIKSEFENLSKKIFGDNNREVATRGYYYVMSLFGINSKETKEELSLIERIENLENVINKKKHTKVIANKSKKSKK